MRIAFFTEMFPPLVNGVAVSVAELAKKLADRGHTIYVFAPKYPGHSFSYPNIRLMPRRAISVPKYKNVKLALPFNPGIFRFIKKEKIGVVHFHTPTPLGLEGIVIAKLLRLPLIGSFHGYFMDKAYLKHVKLNYDFAERLAWKYSNFFYNTCNLVVCPSEGTKAELIARNCKKPVKVIPHGIDTAVFDNAKAALLKKDYNNCGKLLLFVGRIAHEKNILYLLECFALVLKKVGNAKLLIVGDGPQMADIKKKIVTLGMQGKVILLGEMEHEKLVKSGVYGACDVFVHASTTETGPMTVLEAQANGLVCVAVKSKAMKLIRNNVNGYIVDANDKQAFADAVVKLLTKKSVYSRMRKATLASIKKYDMNYIASLWEKTYADIVRNKA
ncbi:glycosyltransferase [Candidatus Woesearchaeota archaeon]|nr:glycosyltransferase [Candidatus Woesearchaeota archaeon]